MRFSQKWCELIFECLSLLGYWKI